MKKIIAALLLGALLALAVFPAALADEGVFGGARELPTFNGLPLGMQMPYALLWEESRGAEPKLRDAESLDDIPPTVETVRFDIGTKEVYGKEAECVYKFVHNALTGVSCSRVFDGREEALAWCETAAGAFRALYGEPNVEGEFFPEDQGNILFSLKWHSPMPLDPRYTMVMDDGREIASPEWTRETMGVECAVQEDGACLVSVFISTQYHWGYESGDLKKFSQKYGPEPFSARYHDARYYLGR